MMLLIGGTSTMEIDTQKLAALIQKHEGTTLTFSYIDANGEQKEVQITSAFYLEDIDGNGMIRLQ